MTHAEHNAIVAALVAQVRANYARVTRRKGEPVLIDMNRDGGFENPNWDGSGAAWAEDRRRASK